MIYESKFWKDDLLARAQELRRLKRRRRWPEEAAAKFEQLIMLGFYAIRKLQDSDKISVETCHKKIALTSYPWTGPALVTKKNVDRSSDKYDFGSPVEVSKELRWLCDRIVHSYVFIPLFSTFNDKDTLAGLLFTSDRERNKRLYRLDIGLVIQVFQDAGNDYPAGGMWTFNVDKQDYDVTLWKGAFDQQSDFSRLYRLFSSGGSAQEKSI